MENIQLQTESSIWLISLCLLIGVGYAVLLYTKDAPWGKAMNYALAFFRTVAVSLLCFLLLGPFLRLVVNYFERPTVVFAIDDSQSMRIGTDSTYLSVITDRLTSLAADLNSEGIDAKVVSLNGEEILGKEELSFDRNDTDLSNVLTSISKKYTDNNLAAIYLLSDGIYNRGFSPAYLHLLTSVNVIAWGDTVPKQDIAVTELLYNKISYAGNRFPIVARVRNIGFSARQVRVVLKKNGKVLQSKIANLKAGEDLQEVEFLHSEDRVGRQHLTVEAEKQPNEFVKENNIAHAYLEIMENREEVLLMAAAPHPDLKAIRAALSLQDNFNLKIYIPGISKWDESIQPDLVIFHQLPRRGVNDSHVQSMLSSDKVSKLFFVTAHTDVQRLAQLTNAVNIGPFGNKTDEVRPALANDFQRFTLNEELPPFFQKLPPILVPYAEVETGANTSTVLWQKVGSVVTDRPLLTLNHKEPRTGVFIGDGLWRWRLSEHQVNGNAEMTDNILLSTFKYLSSRSDRRKFRIFSAKDEYSEGAAVRILAEIYNDLYEPVYGQTVTLKVKGGEGKEYEYTFTTAPNMNEVTLRGLPAGIYDVEGYISRSDQTEQAVTQFSIIETSLESINTTADYDLLRRVAEVSGGNFYMADQIDQIRQKLMDDPYPSTVRAEQEKRPFIDLKWIFWVLFTILSLEWFLRKYKGEY